MESQNITKSQKYQFLEEINIDVNDVLNFSINIDNLKILLTTLIKNQSTLSKKIIDLENKIKYKQSRSSSINSNDDKRDRRSLTLKLPKSKTVIQSTQDDKSQKRMSLNVKGVEELEKLMSSKTDEQPMENGSETIKINENGAKDKDKEGNKKEENNEVDIMESIREVTDEKKTESKNQEESENFDASDNNSKIFDIENKVNSLEKKVKNLEILNKVSKFTVQGEDKTDDIQLMQIEMTNLKDSNKKLLKFISNIF